MWGGAVLVEAILSGRDAIGYDINELALLVSKAKTTFLSRDQIEATGKQVLEKAKLYSGPSLCFGQSERVDYWFKPYMFSPLSALRSSIDFLRDAEIKNLLRVVFSATVRNVSLTYRNEIRLRRMTIAEQDLFNPDVFRKFEEKLLEAARRVPELPLGSKTSVVSLTLR